jgi:prophage regulatory protein
LSFALAKSCFI